MSVLPLAVLTIVCAYVVTITLALGLLLLAHSTAPGWMGHNGQAKPLFLLLNIVIWAFSAAMGGMLVGFLAQWHPNIVAFGFACAIFMAIFLVALKGIGKTSLNYEVVVAACAAICALGGGLLMQFLHLHVTM